MVQTVHVPAVAIHRQSRQHPCRGGDARGRSQRSILGIPQLKIVEKIVDPRFPGGPGTQTSESAQAENMEENELGALLVEHVQPTLLWSTWRPDSLSRMHMRHLLPLSSAHYGVRDTSDLLDGGAISLPSGDRADLVHPMQLVIGLRFHPSAIESVNHNSLWLLC